MDKKSKEVLRRYKKSRQAQSSSESSSSSDSDSGSSSSYSSSDSERRHRHKKARPSGSGRRSTSSSDERHKREKRDHCQKKLEAKRNHLKRKLKEAKLKKKAAAAAAALSGHSHRALSPATQAKLKKLAERKHLRAASKERREREKEKHRAALRERERDHHRIGSRSPTKITKIRIHQDVKRQKTPPRMHHQLMSREKIIIQTRTRDRTPSAERERRHEHKFRHDDMARERDRREREAAREKERAEALARCQERQRERERLAREKLRREEEEKYGKASGSDRLLPRGAEREIPPVRIYDARERSAEKSKRDVDTYEHGYVRKHRGENEFDEESDRRGHLDREELLREREYLPRRRELSPGEYASSSGNRIRGDQHLYPEEERDRPYKRPYLDDGVPRNHTSNREAWLAERELRERDMHDHVRDFRGIESERIYSDERERLPPREGRERPPFVGRPGPEWKRNDWGSPRDRTEWQGDEGGQGNAGRSIGFVGGTKRGGGAGVGIVGKAPPLIPQREKREPSEPDWDAEEGQIDTPKKSEGTPKRDWIEHDQREVPINREKIVPTGRPWNTNEWREGEDSIVPNSVYPRAPGPMMHHPRSDRGGRGGYRGRGGHIEHGERMPGHGFRPHHPPALMNLPVPPPGYHGVGPMPRFPNKRNMTYTNPNILKKQQAALAAAKAAAQASAVAAATTAVAAAKAAAQSAANATTNPSILGHVSGNRQQTNDEKPEAGEIVGDNEQKEFGYEMNSALKEKKNSGELSEISDSDDDILNKTEKRAKNDSDEYNSHGKQETDDKGDEEEVMDFEEISDGELEEERAARGVGDALGVDWSSLVAETKRVPSNQTTTAKQKWQPHRIILDIGISMRMANDEYAKRLICQAKQKLDEELKAENEIKLETRVDVKGEIKEEISSISTIDEDSQATALGNDENTSDVKLKEEILKTDIKTELKMEDIEAETFNVEILPPLACMQVFQQKFEMERRHLITNACGINSRALSARQDLKLRRQLCGLPARECVISKNIPQTSEKLKAMALAAFQRTLQVK